MATPTTKTFAQIVSDQVVAIQGAVSTLVDFTIGSILRAIVEANAAEVMWLQGLILQLLAIARAATCTGADLDSWCADFGFTRLPAVAASGQVTFARFSTGVSAFIAVGTTIQTSDLSPETFTVTADTANQNYSATLGGYTIAAGVTSISVPVLCTATGKIGNVLAGQCNILTQSIPGVDTVTNALAFTNGADAETDTAFRARFVTYIASLAKATRTAIANAIAALGQNADYSITENYDYAGNVQLGHFYVVTDDGSGTPPAGFLSSVNNAVDAVRPFTVSFTVHAPIVTTASVVMTVTVASGYDITATKATVSAALSAFLNAMKIGTTLQFTRLAQIAYDSSPGVLNVSAVTLNGGTADVAADNKHIIRAGIVTIN